MPTTPTGRTIRSTALTAALLSAALAAPAGALAADAAAPTLGPPTIIAAGQTSPIGVGGNHLHQGDTIARGTQLVRWAVTMHGASTAPVTLSCPGSMAESGFGAQEGSQVYPVSGKGFYERTVDVTFRAMPNVDPNTAHGQVYLLCRDMKIAPLTSGLFAPVPPNAVRSAGQRSPVDVRAAHLRNGARIPKGMQLVRSGVVLFDAREHHMTVHCPKGSVVRGLAMRKGAQVRSPILWSRYGRNALKVSFIRSPNADHNQATASVYLACATR